MTTDLRAWRWDSAYPAPAKLNLFLHVVGRRADGYHQLQTVFRFISRADTLRFAPRADGAIVLATPIAGVPPAHDLSVRAARALQIAGAVREGVTIRLEKCLPMGGGLGGGSSDAATVLLALNHLWGCRLPRRELQRIGLALGADVPVFVFGQNAFAGGVGEELAALPLPPATYLVVKPPVEVPTAAIFTAPELRRDTPLIDPTRWRPGDGGNDLEAVACARFPAVAADRDALAAAAGQARMTGSGACVFAEFSDPAAAQAALSRLPDAVAARAWIADGLPEHPLRSLAGEG